MIRLLRADEQLPMDLLLLADPSERIVHQYLEQGKCFVLESESKIIGEVVLLEKTKEVVEIMNIAVNEANQGKGFGRKLIEFAIDWAKEKGYSKLEIGTANSSFSQMALYQKCGFEMTHIDRHFFLKHYDEPFFENGIQVTDMIRFELTV